MLKYVLHRLFHSLFVILGVSAIVFGLTFLKGDPMTILVPESGAMTVDELDTLRHELGFDRPVWVQYLDFLGGAVRGDFGMSLRHREPALQLVVDRLPATVELTLVAFAFALAVALPTGIVSALWRGSATDQVSRVMALLGQCVPNFWLGLMLIILFAVVLRWLPPSGRGGWEYLVLPGITLGAYPAALMSRLLRSSLLEVLGQDYVRTARAKGLAERSVVAAHALKNAAIPVITVMGLQVGHLLGGAVITEQVFSYPGMGRIAVQAIGNRDFTVVQAFVVLTAVIIVVCNLLVDLAYSYLDPRVRYD